MTNFNLFRKKMQSESCCNINYETDFIVNGASSTKIYVPRLKETKSAALVFTDKEGPDSALIYTHKQEVHEYDLKKSDYFLWKDYTFFVYENVKITREVAYIKQQAYQCNVVVRYDGDDEDNLLRGYFLSSLRTYSDLDFQQKLNITDKQQPILIMPNWAYEMLPEKVSIGGKPWKVLEVDNITNPGIAYISIERNFYTKSNDVASVFKADVLLAGQEYTMETADGYLKTSSPLNIKSIAENKIVFSVPFGYTEVEITVKNANGELVTKQYKVEG